MKMLQKNKKQNGQNKTKNNSLVSDNLIKLTKYLGYSCVNEDTFNQMLIDAPDIIEGFLETSINTYGVNIDKNFLEKMNLAWSELITLDIDQINLCDWNKRLGSPNKIIKNNKSNSLVRVSASAIEVLLLFNKTEIRSEDEYDSFRCSLYCFIANLVCILLPKKQMKRTLINKLNRVSVELLKIDFSDLDLDDTNKRLRKTKSLPLYFDL